MVTIGILLFSQVEELDFVAPYEVLSCVNKIQTSSTKILLVAETLDPVNAFNGLKVIPDITLQACPVLDILLVPGGKGRILAMKDRVIKEFIQQQMATVRYMTSVCTGAFLLAEAGLLTGKKATTYHTAFSELASYSVEVISAKVVQDGKIITAGGVSSGLELGFYLLKELFGASVSQEVARQMEYDIDVNVL